MNPLPRGLPWRAGAAVLALAVPSYGADPIALEPVEAFLTDLDSDRLRVDSVTLGLPSGAPAAASGSILIDNYLSTP